MTSSQFRILLIASTILGILGGAVDLLIPGILPEHFAKAQELEDNTLSNFVVFGGLVVALVLLVGTVLAVVGLYRFRTWAPRFALALTALGFLITPAFGATAQSGLAVALMELACTLWGAVLTLAYFSPIASQFERNDA